MHISMLQVVNGEYLHLFYGRSGIGFSCRKWGTTYTIKIADVICDRLQDIERTDTIDIEYDGLVQSVDGFSIDVEDLLGMFSGQKKESISRYFRSLRLQAVNSRI
jgi:hypothetical protein